ncbi:hypothetical protein vBVpaMR16F_219 [Vibrio phage vB_VpaM_R16F]|nr:hypothetical protein vBVpaMR16F_219 [Vibrio phage vB_VpaM_R16F]
MNSETKKFLTKALKKHFGEGNIPTKSEDVWRDSHSVMNMALVCEDLMIALNMLEQEGE